jgi:protein ImuB
LPVASCQLPVVLVKTVATRQLVAALSDAAWGKGVRPGMTLAHARALCPGLRHEAYEPLKDLRALRGLARWMMRFSPVVAVDVDAKEPERYRPAVFLDVTGCERVFGGFANLIEQVDEAMRMMGVSARIAIAPGMGAAWAIASTGEENGRIVPAEKLREALSPLPVGALRIEEEAEGTLFHLGVETIGQLLALPRSSLPARFGETLLRRIDQALARLDEPLESIAWEGPVEARVDFEGVVDALEAIWLTFRDLVNRVVADLARRGAGARKLEVEFCRAYADSLRREILLSRPSRDPSNLFNLMRCAMEAMEGEARRSVQKRLKKSKSQLAHQAIGENFTSDGFTGIRLRVAVWERVTDEQILLHGGEEQEGAAELDHLIERLVLRMGTEAVAQVRLIESYVPERAYRPCAVKEAGGAAATMLTRPLHLLDRPTEIQAIVTPSHDRDGRPIAFTYEGVQRRVVHCVGPERISGQWWEGHCKTRDYFGVEDETGRRSWVFRVHESNTWFMHGEYE